MAVMPGCIPYCPAESGMARQVQPMQQVGRGKVLVVQHRSSTRGMPWHCPGDNNSNTTDTAKRRPSAKGTSTQALHARCNNGCICTRHGGASARLKLSALVTAHGPTAVRRWMQLW